MRSLLLSVVAVLGGLAPRALAQAPVTIGGVTYERVDPGAPFTPAAVPAQDGAAPKPAKAEAAAGMLAYVAPDPGDYRPDRIPKPAESVTRLRVFLTPGEDESLSFAVYALADLEALTVSIDASAAPLSVDVRQVHCWPQRTGWNSRQWYITPELLLPCANGKKTVPVSRGVLQEVPFSLANQQTQGFWLTLSARPDAAPGPYRLNVSVRAAGRPALLLPLEVELLPFTLRKPTDRPWLLYCDSARWQTMSEAQVLAELRDFARHGMDGLIEMPFGAPDVSGLAQGKVTFDAGPYRKYAALCQQAGLAGPHVIGSPGTAPVLAALGLTTDLQKGDWPASVRAGVEAVARAAVAATRDIPARWYYYGVDEPTGDNTYAIQDYQAWHAAGAPTYATFYVPSFLDKAAAFLTAPCFVVGLVSQEQQAREAREACEKTGAEFFWYGTGSYVNPFPQEGFEVHNRYGAGLLFWKTGARAQATWTFCRPHGDVFNDFDGSAENGAEPKEQVTAYPHLLKADDYTTYQGAIPTLAWEGLREGVHDYRYLYTLAELIKQAQTSLDATVRQAAQAAQGELDALAGSVPWANPMGPMPFGSQRLQQVRRLVADRIVTLQNAIRGDAGRTPQRRAERATVRVRTSAGTPQPGMPTLSIPAARQAPLIDGNLDEPAWRQGALASGFSDIRTGQPAELPTQARLLADDQALYVAFDCPEPALAAVAVKEQKHDGSVWLEDGVELFIAGAARTPYAHLVVTSAGVVLDEVNQDSGAWNPRLQVATRPGPNGWAVEIAVPWAELAKAGIQREPIMTLNVGRNRYTKADPQPHTAWAFTGAGFHVPERFGLAFLPEAPLALHDLSIPAQWGAQSLSLALQNRGAEGLEAVVSLEGAGTKTFHLAGGASQAVAFPVRLTTPGPATLRLSWGVRGEAPQWLTLTAIVPPPVHGPGHGDLLRPGSTSEWPIVVNLAPAAQKTHSLLVRVQDGKRVKDYPLEAEAGESVKVSVYSSAVARLQLLLVDRAGKPAWQSPESSFMVLPE
jgi:hypothetical protein